MKWAIRIFQVVLVLVIVVSGVMMYRTYADNKQAEENYKKLQAQYTTKDENNRVRPQFEALEKVNKDINGWIHIDGTAVNYPILKSADNKDYLARDFEKQKSKKGSIFMDYRNDDKNLSKNTVIYGHHVGDGTMFDTLEKYLEQDFYDKHKQIEFDTRYGKYKLEVLSAYRTTARNDYIQTTFKSNAEYDAFLEKTVKSSEIKTDTQVRASDHIVTLSTCEDPFSQTEERIAVVAKLVPVNE